MSTLLIKNIGLLVTSPDSEIKKGKDQGELLFLEDAYILCENDRIAEIGRSGGLPMADETIDAEGCLVTPGLVDPHTHLVFGGWRQNEMAMKLAGAGYLDILKAGGGILSTVRATREAFREELFAKAAEALDEMLKLGTTTCEAKSGYGLRLSDEVKQLEVIRELDEKHVMDLVPTFLGAHAYPEEYRSDHEAYVEQICEMIPYIAEHKLAEFCDVFCETGVFDVEESKKILLKGQECGLRSKIHADEIDAIGGSELAGQLHAISAEHLIVCNEEGIRALSQGNVIACLLPATSLYLSADFAKARRMIEENVAIALGSDYNPGSCPCLNLQLVMTLACQKYKMRPEEVLNAVTINAAQAINRAERIGSLETGKQADIVLWKAKDLNYICYRMGSNLVKQVIKKGKVVA